MLNFLYERGGLNREGAEKRVGLNRSFTGVYCSTVFNVSCFKTVLVLPIICLLNFHIVCITTEIRRKIFHVVFRISIVN